MRLLHVTPTNFNAQARMVIASASVERYLSAPFDSGLPGDQHKGTAVSRERRGADHGLK
jgi:hypothetical protein